MWLVPGAGHLLIGQTRRGIVFAVTIATLLISGLLIGGLGCIDAQRNPLWFYAQVLAGPIPIAVNLTRRHLEQRMPTPTDKPLWAESESDDQPAVPFIAAFDRSADIGTLYCAVAGLLNLLVMIDLLASTDQRQDILEAGPGKKAT